MQHALLRSTCLTNFRQILSRSEKQQQQHHEKRVNWDFKHQRRERQRHKLRIWLVEWTRKNNRVALSALTNEKFCAFLCKTTTWSYHIYRFVDNLSIYVLKAWLNSETLLRKRCFFLCFPEWLNWETYVSNAKFVSGKQKCFGLQAKTSFVSEQQNLFPQ